MAPITLVCFKVLFNYWLPVENAERVNTFRHIYTDHFQCLFRTFPRLLIISNQVLSRWAKHCKWILRTISKAHFFSCFLFRLCKWMNVGAPCWGFCAAPLLCSCECCSTRDWSWSQDNFLRVSSQTQRHFHLVLSRSRTGTGILIE